MVGSHRWPLNWSDRVQAEMAGMPTSGGRRMDASRNHTAARLGGIYGLRCTSQPRPRAISLWGGVSAGVTPRQSADAARPRHAARRRQAPCPSEGGDAPYGCTQRRGLHLCASHAWRVLLLALAHAARGAGSLVGATNSGTRLRGCGAAAAFPSGHVWTKACAGPADCMCTRARERATAVGCTCAFLGRWAGVGGVRAGRAGQRGQVLGG